MLTFVLTKTFVKEGMIYLLHFKLSFQLVEISFLCKSCKSLPTQIHLHMIKMSPVYTTLRHGTAQHSYKMAPVPISSVLGLCIGSLKTDEIGHWFQFSRAVPEYKRGYKYDTIRENRSELCP